MAGRSADAYYLRFLLKAGELLSQSLDVGETLQNVCAAAVDTIADLCILDLLEQGDLDLRACAHRDPELTREIRQAGTHLISAAGRPKHYVRTVVETREPFFAPKIDDDWIANHATSDLHAAFLRRMGYRSMIVVPLTSLTYGVEGTLTLVTTRGGKRPLDSEDAVAFAIDLGRRCGVAIGKARMHQQALEIGWRFQQAALPRALPPFEGVECSALYEPATHSLVVGGDWYDLFPLRDGRIGISVGDVSGHGLDAAVVMASMKNSIHTALIMSPNLPAALSAADFVMQTERSDVYCTAMVGILDPRGRMISCAAAGHPGPKLWIPSKQRVEDPFKERGLPLGLRRLGRKPAHSPAVPLERGSFLVFYTDGLVEGSHDYLEGEQRLNEAIARENVRNARNPATAIRDAVVAGQLHDDLAILTLHLTA